MNINQVPTIQQQPRTASDTAVHYGYVAFQDINLAGPLGLELQVQPDKSPYRRVLPCRELIPFTNIEYGEQDDAKAASKTLTDNRQAAVVRVSKNAKQCSEDVETAYQHWAFVVLRPLTGYSEQDAFDVFQAIQPFRYKLQDIEFQLAEAEYRIEATEVYEATYGDITLELKPLRAELKEVARKVLGLIRASASRAVGLANEIREKTTVSMTSAHAGQGGKLNPDPLDRQMADELGWEPPRLIGSQKESQVITEAPETLDLKRREIELREKELELKMKEIELMEKQQNREKMAAVRAGKNKDYTAEPS